MSDPDVGEATGSMSQEDDSVLILVRNIPSSYHSSNLRAFFSLFVEKRAFICFHFRHRPEKLEVFEGEPPHDAVSKAEKTLCSFVRIRQNCLKEFLQIYNAKNWLDEKNQIMPSRCHIIRVRISSKELSNPKEHNSDSSKYSTRAEKRIEARYHLLYRELQDSDIRLLIEMNPPPLMPQGNVGTPTSHFVQLISSCQMLSGLIKQLGLQFPKGVKNRKYGQVDFSYDDDYWDDSAPRRNDHERIISGSSKTHTPLVWFEKRENIEDDPDGDLDDDTCEEWERHEALNDDVTTHERNKATLFEDEAEVVWEKGGPGIVWHTDANFWKEMNGGDDLDEATDDYDVDMALYYNEESVGRGDKDARDFIQMRREKDMKNGQTESIFRDDLKVGRFEKHTRGVGRKLLEKHGWEEGSGVGKWKKGPADALTGEGQLPYSKKGLGYSGHTLARKPTKVVDYQFSALQRSAVLEPGNNGVRITTKYDAPDKGDSLKRRKAPNPLSYRKKD